MNTQQISILGCGWLGLPLAKNLIEDQYKVKGSTTTSEKIEVLQNEGIESYLFTLGELKNTTTYKDFLKGSEVVIISIPPKRVSDIVAVYQEQIQSILSFIEEGQKVIFISSTSVYQNTNDVVTEMLDNKPEKESGKAVRKVEELLQNHLGKRLTIVRMAGLFGYDRVPANFLASKKNIKNGEAPVNLIHRDDCIGLIKAVIHKSVWGEVINGCSDEHPKRKTFYTKEALRNGLDLPEFDEELVLKYKIVSNVKSKVLLNYDYVRSNFLISQK